MDISIGGYSFHKMLESGKQDIFQYITDCKSLGATQLDPWNAQLKQLSDADDAIRAACNPDDARLGEPDVDYLKRVRAAADEAGVPFGCLAVDGAHIYEPEAAARDGNRILAYRWMEAAAVLGAKQVRIDAGGPEELPEDVMELLVEGYNDIIARASEKGIQILIENHWGPSRVPENVVWILESIPGLGLLFDSDNWSQGMKARGWELCAKYAKSTHVKTFHFNENGDEPSVDLAYAIRLLHESGYAGCWGVESCPEDDDEYGAAAKTIALIKRNLAALAK